MSTEENSFEYDIVKLSAIIEFFKNDTSYMDYQEIRDENSLSDLQSTIHGLLDYGLISLEEAYLFLDKIVYSQIKPKGALYYKDTFNGVYDKWAKKYKTFINEKRRKNGKTKKKSVHWPW